MNGSERFLEAMRVADADLWDVCRMVVQSDLSVKQIINLRQCDLSPRFVAKLSLADKLLISTLCPSVDRKSKKHIFRWNALTHPKLLQHVGKEVCGFAFPDLYALRDFFAEEKVDEDRKVVDLAAWRTLRR